VSSFDVGAKWTFYECDCWKYAASGEFSTFIAGPDGAPWERQNQTVGGLSAMYNESSKFFVEGFHTKGFAPLNFISGGNLGAGETISDAGASSMGFVIGAQITL
ncbi:MAG: hypothetical protein KDK78_07200, partial [Chlamydiia bacterium]|nr:hypothetical protein [Chlamydiia bacterium]